MYYTPPTTDFGRAVMNERMHAATITGSAEPANGRDGPGGAIRRVLGHGLITLGTRIAAGSQAAVPN
jgi:hypothetical protein